jgi:copper chaperone
MEEITLQVNGMTCQGCVRSVTRVLEGVPGVAAVEVSLERGEALVRLDEGGASASRLTQAVEEAGFEARVSGR